MASRPRGTRLGTKARLHRYPTEVLRAALAAEVASPKTSRPLLVSILEAELKRRESTSH